MFTKRFKSVFPSLLFALFAACFWVQPGFGQSVNAQLDGLKTEVARHPESAAANFELARQYYNLQQMSEAQRYFLAVIGIEPAHAEAYAYLGHIYLSQSKYAEAITFFQQALKWQPNNQLALTGVKQIQAHQTQVSQLQEVKTRIAQEKWQEACQQLLDISMSARKLPDYRSLRQQVAQYFYEQGNSFFRAGDWKTAQSFFSKLQELLPDYLDSAQKLQTITQKLNSQTELESLYQAGNQAFQRQNWPDALRNFEKIIKIDRSYKDARQKWQLAFAARDAEKATEEPIEPEVNIPESAPPETTGITSSRQTDSTRFSTQTLDPVIMTKQAPAWLQKIQSYHYWIGLLSLVIAGFLFRQFRRTRSVPRKRRPHPAVPRVNPKHESESVTPAVAQPIKTELKPAPVVTDKLPASPYKRFELKREIARFEPIQVFLAHDRRLNRQVLIDRVELDRKNGGRYVKQIISGVQTVANLNHPHIVRVEDVFFQDEVIFIVLEHVSGIALNEMLTTRKPGDLLKSIQIIRACCLALHFAHQHDLFHTSLHPFNIKLINDETIKLGGFELAVFRKVFPKQADGYFSDFLAYQAPEQLREGANDARSDIFSLGIIFYELLTLNHPFQAESNPAVVFNILEGNPAPPRELNPDIPPKLEGVVLKMLAKNRSDRFFNAMDVALELNKYL